PDARHRLLAALLRASVRFAVPADARVQRLAAERDPTAQEGHLEQGQELRTVAADADPAQPSAVWLLLGARAARGECRLRAPGAQLSGRLARRRLSLLPETDPTAVPSAAHRLRPRRRAPHNGHCGGTAGAATSREMLPAAPGVECANLAGHGDSPGA